MSYKKTIDGKEFEFTGRAFGNGSKFQLLKSKVPSGQVQYRAEYVWINVYRGVIGRGRTIQQASDEATQYILENGQ